MCKALQKHLLFICLLHCKQRLRTTALLQLPANAPISLPSCRFRTSQTSVHDTMLNTSTNNSSEHLTVNCHARLNWSSSHFPLCMRKTWVQSPLVVLLKFRFWLLNFSPFFEGVIQLTDRVTNQNFSVYQAQERLSPFKKPESLHLHCDPLFITHLVFCNCNCKSTVTPIKVAACRGIAPWQWQELWNLQNERKDR